MVKKLIFPLLLLAGCALPALSATARSYDEALKKAGDKKAVVLFCYGANYDGVSTACHEEFIKRRKITSAVRDAVLVVIPIYQQPNERERKEMERALGGRKLPGGIGSYPSITVVDGNGNLRGIIQSAEMMGNAEKASEALRKMLDDFDTQQDYINKALKATGGRQAQLLTAAADVGLMMPREIKIGGKDNEALSARLKFDPIALPVTLEPMSDAAANAHIRKLMANGSYTRAQRQEMMAAYAGDLRRKKASPERLRALYTEMRNIDPHTMYAAYAEEAIRIWVEPREEAEKAEKADK